MAQHFDIIIEDGDVILQGLHQDITYVDAISELYNHAKHFVNVADYDYPDGEFDYNNAVYDYAANNIEDFLHLLPTLCMTITDNHSNN